MQDTTHDFLHDNTDYSTLMENARSQAEFDYWSAHRTRKIMAQGIDLEAWGDRTNEEIAREYGWEYHGYDSGGVLRGRGNIKATDADEIVLGPEMTAKILAPASNAQFTDFVKALGVMFGVSQRAAPEMTPGKQLISSTDSHAVNYYINGVKIGADQMARPMSEVLSTLKLYTN